MASFSLKLLLGLLVLISLHLSFVAAACKSFAVELHRSERGFWYIIQPLKVLTLTFAILSASDLLQMHLLQEQYPDPAGASTVRDPIPHDRP